ncbi:MAG: S1 family peptidase [Chloroflexota bacterium]|nr:S1 family peptidase [Chloroflexota bacterium]
MKFHKTILTLLVAMLAVIGTTATVVHGQQAGDATEMPDVAAPEINDPISAAELEDLKAVASQYGISLQAAMDRYGWNDNFGLAVAKIREAAPDAFTGAEIVDASNAWVAFAGEAPQAALDIIGAFRSSHSGVSVEVRTDKGFTEVELEKAIEAAHFAVFNATEVRDTSTTFDYATGEIKAVVVLANSTSGSALDDLRAVAETNSANSTRADILNNITISVVRSDHDILGGSDSSTEHLGGEALSPNCTFGFGTKSSSGVRGIATAGHCPNLLTDDGASLTFKAEHVDTYGDFQWYTGSQTETDDFYAGNTVSVEVNRRDVSAVESPTVGQMLCRNGKKTFRRCQKVRKLNVCVGSMCNLVQMGARRAKSGDSGGPVFKGNTAYGLHQGWMDDPWPFKRDLFSRADQIYNALGTHIATD